MNNTVTFVMGAYSPNPSEKLHFSHRQDVGHKDTSGDYSFHPDNL